MKHGQAANERQTQPAPAGEAGDLSTAESGTAIFVESGRAGADRGAAPLKCDRPPIAGGADAGDIAGIEETDMLRSVIRRAL
ncbi:MAG: hypothetical protein ACJ8BE_01970, partial [Microvirga sp.]